MKPDKESTHDSNHISALTFNASRAAFDQLVKQTRGLHDFARTSELVHDTGLSWNSAELVQSVLDRTTTFNAAKSAAEKLGWSGIDLYQLNRLANLNLPTEEIIERVVGADVTPQAIKTLRDALNSHDSWRSVNGPVYKAASGAEYRLSPLGESRPERKPLPRRDRDPEDFFSQFETVITSCEQLLTVLSEMQRVQKNLGLVWRGQQRSEWSVNSSLTRQLLDHDLAAGEEHMVGVELHQVEAADRWGIPHDAGLNYLAELQHEGAPTRLIDVTLDPEVAVWFAVQAEEKHNNSDGRIFAWGRSSSPAWNNIVKGGSTFWQKWDHEKRVESNWGTSTTLLSWQPVALNERMRAQRAAFLFDAAPIIDETVLSRINEKLGEEWTTDELSLATRIVGMPTGHDEPVDTQTGDVVPMFTLRITRDAKEGIRDYLESKGLDEAFIYPDRAGLIGYLSRKLIG